MPEPISTGTAILGAAALGTGASLYGASQAADAQENAANQAANSQAAMLERQIALQEPFRQAGLTAQNRLMDVLGLSGNASAESFKTDPGYAFRLSEGMKALERSAAARGGLLSGATMKGVTRFGQDTASQEYSNIVNRLLAVRSGAQSAATSMSGAMGQAGQGIAGAQMGAGAARASGYTGMANALTSGLSTGANLYMQQPLYRLIDRLNAAPGAGATAGGLTYPTAPSYEAGWASTNWMM